MKPSRRPERPNFSSGPCAKRPGWSPAVLGNALLGRSHRAPAGIAKLNAVLDRTRALLDLPADFRLAIVPASDTGAFEMALWSLDVVKQLKIEDVRVLKADYGSLPDLGQVGGDRDVVFTWNGTTSGVRVPNGDWIATDRQGLTICDATSAVFLMELPWDKIDAASYSWQKALGGEPARHADPEPAGGRPARKPHAALAAAENLPPHQGWPAQRGRVCRPHHQHTLHAVR